MLSGYDILFNNDNVHELYKFIIGFSSNKYVIAIHLILFCWLLIWKQIYLLIYKNGTPKAVVPSHPPPVFPCYTVEHVLQMYYTFNPVL